MGDIHKNPATLIPVPTFFKLGPQQDPILRALCADLGFHTREVSCRFHIREVFFGMVGIPFQNS